MASSNTVSSKSPSCTACHSEKAVPSMQVVFNNCQINEWCPPFVSCPLRPNGNSALRVCPHTGLNLVILFSSCQKNQFLCDLNACVCLGSSHYPLGSPPMSLWEGRLEHGPGIGWRTQFLLLLRWGQEM